MSSHSPETGGRPCVTDFSDLPLALRTRVEVIELVVVTMRIGPHSLQSTELCVVALVRCQMMAELMPKEKLQ